MIDLGGLANQLQVVAQPLHDRAADEDAAFERIFQFLVQAADERGDQSLLREHELVADVLQQEAARTVGVLGVAGMDAQLAEKRRLLISRDARDLGHPRPREVVTWPIFRLTRPPPASCSREFQATSADPDPIVFDDVVEHGAAKRWCGR